MASDTTSPGTAHAQLPHRQRIDWLGKVNHLLQTMAFCLAVSALQVNFVKAQPYIIPTIYSLGIGTATWAVIDLGRHLFPSAQETGWPQGMSGLFLPLIGIVVGYFCGTLIGDWVFGFSSFSDNEGARSQLPISIAITVLAGVIGTYYFYTRNRQAWMETKIAEVRRQASEAQLKLLETQLEPHMLFNTLANLRALIGIDPAAAQEMLDRLIAYLRATLDASRKLTHPLSSEFERTRDYLELMAIRMGPRLAYTLDLPESLGALQVPTLLLQPLVENSIKHGLEPQVSGGEINVSARLEGSALVIEIADTGRGYVPSPTSEDSKESGGFGLAQVRERLATMYGDQGHIHMDVADRNAPAQKGCRAVIHLPLLS